MDFKDQEIDINLENERVRVRIKADLIHLLWGESVGPHSAEGIVLANMEIIRTLAAGKAEKSGILSIEIGAIDYEQEDQSEDVPLD
jgi:hypothetical protein